MHTILTVSGSTQKVSRSGSLLDQIAARLAERGHGTGTIRVRDLPADDLLHARAGSATLADAIGRVAGARAVVFGTPVYKASYSGAIKSFLDLLPQDALAGAVVLPVATGGSPAHLLAIDYALRPVLASLGARWILPGVFAADSQFAWVEGQGYVFDQPTHERIDVAVEHMADALDTFDLIEARCRA